MSNSRIAWGRFCWPWTPWKISEPRSQSYDSSRFSHVFQGLRKISNPIKMTSRKSSRKWLFTPIQVLVEVQIIKWIIFWNKTWSLASKFTSLNLCSSSATRIDITCWTYLYHKVLPTPVSRHPNHSLHCCRKRWIALRERPWPQESSSTCCFVHVFMMDLSTHISYLWQDGKSYRIPKSYSDSTSGVVRFALLKG